MQRIDLYLCPLSDGKPPLCLDTNKDIYNEKYFSFYNSALYTPSHNADVTTKSCVRWQFRVLNIS